MTAGQIRRGFVSEVGGRLAGGLLRSVRFTAVHTSNLESARGSGKPIVFALWHGRLLPLSYYHRSWSLVTLISQSADGEYIARLVQRWGYTVIRGSTSRGGGPAFRNVLRALRSGLSVAITPDGPRGPREKVKPGIIAAAQLTGCPIVPVGAGSIRSWWIEGWDRFMVPRPFSSVHVVYGPPLTVPRDASPEDVAAVTSRLESALIEANAAAERHAAG